MKANGTLISFLVFAMLLAAFGFTAFRYFIIALSTGFLDLSYLIVIWIVLVMTARLNAVTSYAVACVCGVLLAFPLSLFIHVSEMGHIEFADAPAFSSMISHGIIVLWMLEYIAAAVIAQFAMRFLWRGLNAKGST